VSPVTARAFRAPWLRLGFPVPKGVSRTGLSITLCQQPNRLPSGERPASTENNDHASQTGEQAAEERLLPGLRLGESTRNRIHASKSYLDPDRRDLHQALREVERHPMIDRSTGRRLLGPSRVQIMSNGSGDPEPLSALIDRLDGIPLDPRWEREYGNFAFTSNLYFQRRGSNKHTHRKVWEDFGPAYSDAPNAVLFFGNFYQTSGLFHIVTDDSEIIDVVLDAIDANLRSRLPEGQVKLQGPRTNSASRSKKCSNGLEAGDHGGLAGVMADNGNPPRYRVRAGVRLVARQAWPRGAGKQSSSCWSLPRSSYNSQVH